MKNKILFIFFVIIFITIFFVFFKGLQNSNIYVPKAVVEKNIPSFKIKIFDTDDEINSEEIFKKDKFYLLNIWASWCVPCRDEHPFLMKLSKQKNIEIIGLNYKDDNKNAKKFLREYNNPYTIIVSDKNGIISIKWGSYGVPETFLIYNEKIIKRIIGPIGNELFLEIKKLTQ